MNKRNIKKLKKVMNKIINNLPNENIIDKRLKDTLKRISNEFEFCISYEVGNEYFPVQQFRILMDKIVNSINLIKLGNSYYEYLELLEESTIIKEKRVFLRSQIVDSSKLDDRNKFFNRRAKNYSEIDLERIETFKFYKFEYDVKSLSKDSSLVIHDDNSSYKFSIGKNVLLDIENIVLFFISNIFISVYKLKKTNKKDYLKEIHKQSKEKILKSELIKRKELRKIKEKIRNTAQKN